MSGKYHAIKESLKRFFLLCYNYVNKSKVLKLSLIFALFFIIFFSVYFSVSTLSSSDDHFFHFQFAEQMREHGFFSSLQDFKTLYFSKMAQGNQYFIYYNFLFYLVAIPFTYIAPLYLGIKLYAVFAITIAVVLLYWCVEKIDIKKPLLWTVIMLAISNTDSIWRFFLSRPYALAPSLLLVLLVFLYKKKYWGIFFLTIFYIYWHSATFFMPIGVVIVYCIMRRFYGVKSDYKSLIACVGGTVVAIAGTYLVSSGFILYMKEIIFGSYADTIIGKKINIAEGGELYPIDIINLVKVNGLVFMAFVSALAVDIFGYIAYKWKKITAAEYFLDLGKERKILQTTMLFLIALFFLGTVAISGRFGDYFTFFAVIYVAFSFDYVFRSLSISGSKAIKRGLASGLIVALIYIFSSNLFFLQDRLAHGARENEFYRIGTWLEMNTKPHDIVFVSNWGLFPELYYFSPENYYTSGIEPRFLYTYNPELYWLSIHIAQNGYVCTTEKCPDLDAQEVAAFRTNDGAEKWAKNEGDKIVDVLTQQFHSQYIVTTTSYMTFNYILNHNSHFQDMVYDTNYGNAVYKIK